MNKILWPLLALLSGAALPIQAGFNARLGKAIESPVYAALISFLIGAVGLMLYVILTRENISLTKMTNVPVHAWLGGLLGALYVTIVILAFPRIGAAFTFGLVVAGQMVTAVVLDHFNLLVADPHPVNFWRLVGVFLVVVGVLMVRIF